MRRFIEILGIILIVISVAVIALFQMGYLNSNKAYDKAKESYVIETTEDKEQVAWYDMADVDFSAAQDVNSDVIGWIYEENGDISYPILFSGDNETYLRQTYDYQTAVAGSIFLDGSCQPDFSDLHGILYGHNMRNLSMFGSLKLYMREDNYIDDHMYFQIITEDKKYRYKVISFRQAVADENLYTVYPDGALGLSDFYYDVLLKGTLYDSGEKVTDEDHLLTFSTCSSGENGRFTLTLKRVDEKDY